MLRHGQSEWNALRRWQGAADIALTDLGRAQARETAERLASLARSFDAMVASDLLRASETAAIIARRLDLPVPTTDVRLREAHAGEWQGMTPDEIERRYPGWLDDHRRPDTFEAYDAVVARGSAAVCDAAVAAGPGATIAVVSHSGLIRSIIRSHGIADTRIPNLGGIWLSVAHHDGDAADRITIGTLFDPGDIERTGLDMSGEDPGEQPDHADADRARQH